MATNIVPITCNTVSLFLKTIEDINNETNFLSVRMNVTVTDVSFVAKS